METVRSDVDAPDRSVQADRSGGGLEATRRVRVERPQSLEELESSRPQEAAASLEVIPQMSDGTATEILPISDVPPKLDDVEAPPEEAKAGAADTIVSEIDAASDESAEATLVNLPATGDRAYALQLIGFYSRDSLQAFASREDLPKRIYYLAEKHRGRPWFALIHSLHADYASAQEAVSRLAPDLIAMKPWIRPLRGSEELLLLESGEAP
jgi:DamX protein